MKRLTSIARWPIWSMLRKEFIQMRRDRLTLGMMIGIPALQLTLFGYAIQTEVRHLPTVMLDQSQSPESRRLIQGMIEADGGNINMTGRMRIGSVPQDPPGGDITVLDAVLAADVERTAAQHDVTLRTVESTYQTARTMLHGQTAIG